MVLIQYDCSTLTQSLFRCICCFLLILAGTKARSIAGPESGEDIGPEIVYFGTDCRVERLQSGIRLFSDRNYTLKELPTFLEGRHFLRGSIEGIRFQVTQPGDLFILIPVKEHPRTRFQGEILEQAGYRPVANPSSIWLFGPDPAERAVIYRKHVQAGERLSLGKFAILVGVRSARKWADQPWTENRGEVLENGIVLPEVWPPQNRDPASDEPMPVPYLMHPPKVIPIDRGRQLFVDDFLIESTNLKRVYHRAKKYAHNPVFKPETVYELSVSPQGKNDRPADCYLGHGGVFYDPDSKLFRMYYTAGWRGGLALATSPDMVHWTRPELGLAGGNLLLPPGLDPREGPLQTAGSDNCVWYDINAPQSERIKYLACWDHGKKGLRPNSYTHRLNVSDGVRWSAGANTGRAGDYCSFFWNPFRNVWVFSIKRDGPRGRSRYYSENPNFLAGADWSNSVYWTNADRLDRPEPEGRYPGAGEPTQLYSLNAVAYESLLVGMHYIHRGPNNKVCNEGDFPKLTDLELGFSRDGFHWDRPDRSGFLVGERTEGAWDRAYLHGATGVFTIMGDKLVFPYTAYSGISPSGLKGMYTGGSVGIATLRRDGFASMEAGPEGGELTTRPVKFSGKFLFVNAALAGGSMRVSILDEHGNEMSPWTVERCRPVTGDSTLMAVIWEGQVDLSALAGQTVKFRFHVNNGALYSFWVSPTEFGASNGYLAAGGPGYPGLVDTVGRNALSDQQQTIRVE